MIREILLLGDPRLYAVSAPAEESEAPALRDTAEDLHETLLEYRRVHGAGRAIAAPQIGVCRRMIHLSAGERTITLLNPVLSFPDNETMEVLDDCMSFPGLLVRLRRYRRCAVTYRDLQWREHTLSLEGELSELLQHEYDHLDGILATMRAEDNKSLVYRR